jgi:glutaryl-CoA dehydrogenase
MSKLLRIPFDWQSPFLFEEQLTAEEKLIQKTAQDYAQSKLFPRILKAFREESFDKNILREMGELGFLGATLKEYGCAGVSYVSYGLIAREIERVDSAYRSAASVQSSLIIYPIYVYGSKAQKEKYLPKLVSGEWVGSFCLTEPNHGSDPSGMQTKAKKVKGGYEISGSKTWITNASIADIFIVWVKNDENKIQGFILEKNMKGLSVVAMHNKFSLRASLTGEVFMDKVFVPDENSLEEAKGLGAAIHCLENARYGIAWGALGAAEFCFHTARNYVLERKQFNKPLGANQLIQYKLAEMETKITLGLQGCLRLGRLKAENKASTESISMMKRYSTLSALDVARESRDMLGGNGIMDEYHVIRHVLNLETVKIRGNSRYSCVDFRRRNYRHSCFLKYKLGNIDEFWISAQTRSLGKIA